MLGVQAKQTVQLPLEVAQSWSEVASAGPVSACFTLQSSLPESVSEVYQAVVSCLFQYICKSVPVVLHILFVCSV